MITDRKEEVGIEVGPSVLIARVGVPTKEPQVTLSGPRRLILGLFALGLPIEALQGAGLKVEGDVKVVKALSAALDPVPSGFNIAEP